MVSAYVVYTIPPVTHTCKTITHILRKHTKIKVGPQNSLNIVRMLILLWIKASTKYVISE